MKTVKKIIISLIFLSFTLSVKAQDTFYKALPNIVNADEEAGTIHTELNYQFRIMQAQLLYNISDTFFLFGAYNFDNSKKTSRTFLFGDLRTVERNNSGFSLGVGIQKLGTIGTYEHLELLMGLEKQKVDNSGFFTESESPSIDNLIEDYYKIFAQFNVMKNRTNFDYGYSLKASYFKFTKIKYNGVTRAFQGKTLIFLDPTVNFNYKFLSSKNMAASTQIGVSVPLSNLNATSSRSGVIVESSQSYLLSLIFKIGIRYRFNSK